MILSDSRFKKGTAYHSQKTFLSYQHLKAPKIHDFEAFSINLISEIPLVAKFICILFAITIL